MNQQIGHNCTENGPPRPDLRLLRTAGRFGRAAMPLPVTSTIVRDVIRDVIRNEGAVGQRPQRAPQISVAGGDEHLSPSDRGGHCENGGAVPPPGCVLDDLRGDAEALTTTPPVRVAEVHRS